MEEQRIKRVKKLDGFFGFTEEGRAIIMIGDKRAITSTVEKASIHGGTVYLETQNSIYTNIRS